MDRIAEHELGKLAILIISTVDSWHSLEYVVTEFIGSGSIEQLVFVDYLLPNVFRPVTLNALNSVRILNAKCTTGTPWLKYRFDSLENTALHNKELGSPSKCFAIQLFPLPLLEA